MPNTVQYFAVRRKQTELDKVIEALLFSFLLYLLTLPWLGYTLPISWRETSPTIFQVTLRWTQLAVLTTASLAFGILYAASINRDWLLRFFRWTGITAAWIDKDGTERSIDGPGILITKEVGIEYVVSSNPGSGN